MIRKNDLIEAFNQSCIAFSAFMDAHLEDEFPVGEEIATIPFINTQIPDLDEIWWDEENIIDARNYFDFLPGGAQIARTAMGYEMLESVPAHLAQFNKIEKRTKDKKELFYILPQMIDYASAIQDTNGYETLKTVCGELGNVSLSPWLVTNPKTDNLMESFMLAVRMQATDSIPLRDKIITQAHKGLFENVREHYGLS